MIQDSLVLARSTVPVRRARITSSMISASSQKVKYRIQSLAEAVILQSIEDLFDPSQRKKSIDFFKSENFNLCAEIAGLSAVDQIRIIRMLFNKEIVERLRLFNSRENDETAYTTRKELYLIQRHRRLVKHRAAD